MYLPISMYLPIACEWNSDLRTRNCKGMEQIIFFSLFKFSWQISSFLRKNCTVEYLKRYMRKLI